MSNLPHPRELPVTVSSGKVSPIRQAPPVPVPVPVPVPANAVDVAYLELREQYNAMLLAYDEVVYGQVMPLQTRLSELAALLSEERTHREGLGILVAEKDKQIESLRSEMQRQKLLEYMVGKKKDDIIARYEEVAPLATSTGSHEDFTATDQTHPQPYDRDHPDCDRSSIALSQQHGRTGSPTSHHGNVSSVNFDGKGTGSRGRISQGSTAARGRAGTMGNPNTSGNLSFGGRRKSDVSFVNTPHSEEGLKSWGREDEEEEEGGHGLVQSEYGEEEQEEREVVVEMKKKHQEEQDELVKKFEEHNAEVQRVAEEEALDVKRQLDDVRRQLENAEELVGMLQKEKHEVTAAAKVADEQQEKELNSIKEEIGRYRQAEDEMPAAIQEAEGQIMELQQQLQDQKKDASGVYNDMKAEFTKKFSETVGELDEQIDVLTQKTKSLKDEVAEHDKEKNALHKLTQQLRQAYAQASREGSAMEKRAHAFEEENKILKSTASHGERERERLEDRIKTLEAMKTKMEGRVGVMNDEYTALLSRHNDVEAEKTNYQRKVTEVEGQLGEIQNEHTSQLRNSEQELIRLMGRVEGVDELTGAMEAEIDALQDALACEKIKGEDERRRADREEIVAKRLREEAQRARSDVETLRAVLTQQSGILEGADLALIERDDIMAALQAERDTIQRENSILQEELHVTRETLHQRDSQTTEFEKRWCESERRVDAGHRKNAEWGVRENELLSKIQDLEGGVGQLRASFTATKQAAAAAETRALDEERRAVTAEGEARILEARVTTLTKELLDAQTQLHKSHLSMTPLKPSLMQSEAVSPRRTHPPVPFLG